MILDFIYTYWKTFLIILIAGASCRNCAKDHIDGSNEKEVANYEALIKENSQITAIYDSVYTERTIKVAGLPIKTYDIKYKFQIDGETYQGEEKGIPKLPQLPVVNVYYLKDNPSINSIDPKKSLEFEKEKDSSNTNLYFSIFWGIVTIFSIIGLWNKFKKFKKEYSV